METSDLGLIISLARRRQYLLDNAATGLRRGGYFGNKVGASGVGGLVYIHVTACITRGSGLLDTICGGIQFGTRGAFGLGGFLGLAGLVGLIDFANPISDGSNRSGASGSRYNNGDNIAAWCLKGKCLQE